MDILKTEYGESGEFDHVPVLLEACLNALRVRPDGVYVDGTLGRAGHAAEIARRLTTGRLIGVDRDRAAIDAAARRLAPWRDRVTLLHGNFSDLKALLEQAEVSGVDGMLVTLLHGNFSDLKTLLDQAEVSDVDGMLFDLGVSSPQLDDPRRGFSYLRDGPLDMRMDDSAPLTAADVVNQWSETELRRILFEYGEERYAPLIARAIVRARERAPLETTGELAALIKNAMPGKALREKQHPAKRSFQAIRIAVNGELDALETMLESAADCLRPGGRLAVITFHSLEDRIVKRAFREMARGCTCPPSFPVCVCGRRPKLRLINRKPITADEAEIESNPRSRSAKLRVAEKTDLEETNVSEQAGQKQLY